MRSKDLAAVWSRPDSSRLVPKQISVRLPVHVMARVRALEEMYPTRTRTEIIGDLLSAALDEMEAGFPQYKGAQLSVLDPSTSEPMYEVCGPVMDFRAKANRYYSELEKELGNQNPSPLFSSETYVDIESAFEK